MGLKCMTGLPVAELGNIIIELLSHHYVFFNWQLSHVLRIPRAKSFRKLEKDQQKDDFPTTPDAAAASRIHPKPLNKEKDGH